MDTAGLIAYLKAFAGYAPSKSNIYKLTMRNQIPHLKGPGKRVLFPIEDIRGWVESGGQMPDNKSEGAK